MQISSFAPLAPLSPSHRVGAPATGVHEGPTAAEEASTSALVADVTQLLGASLPPSSLLPAIGGAQAGADSGRSTEAPVEPAVDLPGASGLPGAGADTAAAAAGGAAASEETPDGDGLSPDAELTKEEQQEVDKLKARDREVRQHEQAHLAAAGPHANGGPSYEYTRGPDGKRYATGGEVSIDTSKEDEPEATIRKAQQIYRAALAPAEPSPQDRRVAAEAKQMEMEARAEISEQRNEEGAERAEPGGASRPEDATGAAEGVRSVGGGSGVGDAGAHDGHAHAAAGSASRSAPPATAAVAGIGGSALLDLLA